MKTHHWLLLLWFLSSATVAQAQGTPAGLESEARALAQQFIEKIRPELQKAMAEGGPPWAIEVCAGIAPRIADALSVESGWMVRRVSLNPRNASRAVPDTWEREVLEDFDRRRAAGEAPGELVAAETVGSEYRYMQAQVVEGICLTCHGTSPSAAARETLSEYYPDDAATGYELGQVRGAISLRRPLAR